MTGGTCKAGHGHPSGTRGFASGLRYDVMFKVISFLQYILLLRNTPYVALTTFG